jgi:predicted DNA binding CopG/RHH family protein
MDRYSTQYIDSEEKELMESIKGIDISKYKRPTKKELNKMSRAAKAYIKKEYKMNIRISKNELSQIKARAEIEGLKYQTLVKSVLHKYVTGQLFEKKQKSG